MDAVLTRFAPLRVLAWGDAADVPLLRDRPTVDGRAAAYVCEHFVCQAPVTDVASLQALLSNPDLLRTLRNDGMTIVLVEHDMEFVMNLVDRIVVMDFGSKLAEGVPAAIRAEPRVQEAYLGGVA